MRVLTKVLMYDMGIKHSSPLNRIQWTAVITTLAMWLASV